MFFNSLISLPDKYAHLQEIIKIYQSNGRAAGGKIVWFICPKHKGDIYISFMRRRITGGTTAELIQKAVKIIEKWYYPATIYSIDDRLVMANSPENALKEYWRCCEKSKVGRPFHVSIACIFD